MLLINGDDSDVSPEQMQNTLEKYQHWRAKWQKTGNYIEGSPFKPEGRLLKSGETVMKEGAFMDSENRMGGFIWIKAVDIDEATQIALECPLLENLEIIVRPFMKIN